MLAEAQSFIATRMMGWSGLWSVTASENDRMVSEKSDAITQSMQGATLAAMTGKRPDDILNAAVKSLAPESPRQCQTPWQARPDKDELSLCQP